MDCTTRSTDEQKHPRRKRLSLDPWASERMRCYIRERRTTPIRTMSLKKTSSSLSHCGHSLQLVSQHDFHYQWSRRPRICQRRPLPKRRIIELLGVRVWRQVVQSAAPRVDSTDWKVQCRHCRDQAAQCTSIEHYRTPQDEISLPAAQP